METHIQSNFNEQQVSNHDLILKYCMKSHVLCEEEGHKKVVMKSNRDPELSEDI
jgi:hypothetical protein